MVVLGLTDVGRRRARGADRILAHPAPGRGLVSRHAEGVTIEAAGVGYEIAMTPRDLATLPAIGEEVVVHTHLHVREDQLALFGFVDEDGRTVFRHLLGASGVGPKLALAILGTLGADRLRAAVVGEDVDTLTTVPGIGVRSAQKLVLDLRARLALPSGGIPTGGGMAASVIRKPSVVAMLGMIIPAPFVIPAM